MTFCKKNRIIRENKLSEQKITFFILLELARIATLRATKENAGEMMFFDVLGLVLADFFGAFALVTMEHVSVDIRFLLDSSDLLVVTSAGFLLFCHGSE